MQRLFWIEVDRSNDADLPVSIWAGVGVTAENELEAKKIAIEKVVGTNCDIGSLTAVVVQSLEELDQNHVRPNIGNFLKKGVWYPVGYDD